MTLFSPRGISCRCRFAIVAASRRRAFTLIELLVVIAIICVLVSVLMPSLRQAKVLAQCAACSSNLQALGLAAAQYQGDYGDWVPMGFQNKPTANPPLVSWRANLLPYTSGFATFNCPCAVDDISKTPIAQVFHANGEITGAIPDSLGTANSGSYAVMDQPSADGAVGIYGGLTTPAYSTLPGKGWADPFNSIYLADAAPCNGTLPVTYPSSTQRTNNGTAYIFPPPFFTNPLAPTSYALTRRFYDRHLGTNCLFLGGYAMTIRTQLLDTMALRASDCVWDQY